MRNTRLRLPDLFGDLFDELDRLILTAFAGPTRTA
jgi:hypothetical protein